MRALLDFPDGFGTDPTVMLGPSIHTGRSQERREISLPAVEAEGSSPTASDYVPGPFRARSISGLSLDPSETEIVSETSGGFRPRLTSDEDAEPVWREPGSIVVPTVVVGILLAAMGYFLDVR